MASGLLARSAALVWTMAVAAGGAVAGPRPSAATQPGEGAGVPVKQVVLFSSGVGYFEHAGSVRDDGGTTLHFKTDQINDILKSLLLEDLDGGRVGTVSYPNPAPLARTLRSFQVDVTGNPPLADLLNQLRGTRVSVVTTGGSREGVVLGVERKRRAVGENDVVSENVLNLRSGATIRPIVLDQVQSLEIGDERLNRELDAALSELAAARGQDKKPVEIRFSGRGERRVRIGYVAETPVWKTSYRLVFDKADGAAADANGAASPGGKMQGWAVVENQTDSDWTDVELSLVSGRPISFIQDLYHSLYVPRPFVAPQIYASLVPQTYENGITRADVDQMQQRQQEAANPVQYKGTGIGQGGGGGGGTQASNQLFQNANQLGASNRQGQQAGPINPITSVVSAAEASGLGELFEYTVGNVSIRRQQSAMIPIVTDEIDIKKVSIYNRGVLESHPLNGVRLKNTTRKHLLGGPVTVIEAGSYAGDARMEDVPPDERRLMSYGIDLKMNAVVTDEPAYSGVEVARIVRGVLYLQWKDVSRTKYVFTNHSGRERTLVLEHPAETDWTLAEPAKADEKTATVYRFIRKVPADAPLEMRVRTEMLREERVEILPLEMDNLVLYAGMEPIPAAIREALGQIITLKKVVAATQQQLEARRRQVAEIGSEQSRIRENMRAVAQSTDYYTRLVKKLDEQESQIEALQKEADALAKQLAEQRKEFETRARGLTVG